MIKKKRVTAVASLQYIHIYRLTNGGRWDEKQTVPNSRVALKISVADGFDELLSYFDDFLLPHCKDTYLEDVSGDQMWYICLLHVSLLIFLEIDL